MRIRGWSIDGFGHFCDYDVSDIPDGITVFHGPNEAGKSTLLAFIRGMLFGFPDRRGREARYEPLRGGRHGGRLMLDVDGESWTLQRDAGARGGASGVRVITPRGEGSDDDLRRALGSADTRLFRSVFAFSLTELQSFDTLSDEGARSRIFSAGIVGAGRAARQAISEIGERADALYKPRGRTQLVPTLIRQLGERRQATAAARRAAREYPELVDTQDSCAAKSQRIAASLAGARRSVRHFQDLAALWPIWNDLQEAEAQYAALEAIDTFLPDPERRLAEALSRLSTARGRVAELRAEHDDTEARVAAGRGEVRAELAALVPEVAAHFEARNLYQSNAARLQTARVELAHATDAADRQVRSLGEGWDADRLAAFDASLPQRDRIRTWGQRLGKATEDVATAERDEAAAARALQQAERDHATAAERLRAIEVPDLERIDTLDAALRRLRGRLGERRDREHVVAQRRAVLDEREGALRFLESQSEPEPVATPDGLDGGAGAVPARAGLAVGSHAASGATLGAASSPSSDRGPGEASGDGGTRLLPLAVVVLGVIVAGVLATTRPALGLVVAVLAVVAGVGVAAWLRHARAATMRTRAAERRAADARLAEAERTTAAERAATAERLAVMERVASERLATAERQAAARRQEHARRVEAARQRVVDAREAVARAEYEVKDVRASTKPDAAVLGVCADPAPEDLDGVDRRLAQQRRDADRVEQLRRSASDAETWLHGGHDHADAAGRRTQDARAALAAAGQAWATWALARGVPAEMSPASALDFVPAVQQARAGQEGVQKLRASVDVLGADVRRWEDRAVQLLARGGETLPAEGRHGSALLEALHRLHARCAADIEARERLAAAEADLQACRRRLDAAAAELTRGEADWAALLADAGAHDEAHYRSRMQAFAERERLRREIDRLHRQLAGHIGEGSDAAAIRATLATGAVAEWAREHERYEGEVAALEQQHEEAIRAHQDAQRRREALETSADVPGCEAEEQAVRAELSEAVDRWRTLALARALTEDTLREYVRTRQPAVLAQASEMFASVTSGAYPELRQDERGDGLSVVTRRGEVLGPEQLSRGTAEQLYLCLRLGLAAEFSAHGARLPIVMDDVCVNFDPERARAIAGVLREFAVGQQILFFTCHPTTTAMLAAVVPNLRVHTMPRFGAPGGSNDAAVAGSRS